MKPIAALILLLAPVALGQSFDPPPKGHWAVDRTGKVSAATLRELDDIGSQLEANGGGQLGVLVIDSTHGQVPRAFATRIFNQWGIGHAGTNDGVFLFVALGDHKSEIVLGTGAAVTSAQTDVVMREELVANFKRGAVDAGLLAAAHSLQGRMTRAAAPATHPVAATQEVDTGLMTYIRHEAAFPEHSPRSWVLDLGNQLNASQRAQLDVAASDVYASNKGRVFYLLYSSRGDYPSMPQLAGALAGQVKALSRLPVAVVAWDETSGRLFLRLPETLQPTGWQLEQFRLLQNRLADQIMQDRAHGLAAAGAAVGELLLQGLPQRPTGEVLSQGFTEHQVPIYAGSALTLLGGVLFGRRWNRRRTRSCENCHEPRELLSEAQEDDYLEQRAQVEESLGSVEYDVWWCGRCNDVLVLDYTSWFSRYSRCPSCSARAKTSSSTTLSSATEYSGGLVQIDEQCAACSYRNSYTRTTSRLSSSDSSSFSSSSSSSDSGSSFGGGSSDGGGSSGSW